MFVVPLLSLTDSGGSTQGGREGGAEGGREGELIRQADPTGGVVKHDVERAEAKRTEDNRVALVPPLPPSLPPSLPSHDAQGSVGIPVFIRG